MQFEDYFDVLAPDDIRIKGTRIGIETILHDFVHRGDSPETIAERYRTVTLEPVYATITDYLHNREAVSAYVADWLEASRELEEQHDRNPPPVVERLRQFATQQPQAGAVRA